ncbi:MAG TPA: alpha/beta hydrolase, partial [Paracoccaceae bacterium]|nr:alpha/beta hydrolase [Paracoccaceae bacterium]
PATHEVPIEVTRQAREEGKGIFPPGGPLEGSDWTPLAHGNRVRLSPAAGRPRGIYFHVHGGGWSLGSPAYHDRENQEIARETGMSVVSVQYRLAPENRWPAQIEDVLAGADWVFTQWPDLPVVIGGESAGAHLAATALLALRERGRIGRIAGAALNYGMYDLRMTASMALWGPRKVILSTPTVAWFLDNLLPPQADRADPAVSPLLASLQGLPTALFQVGTADPLLDDTLMMAARWVGAGLAAELAVYPGGIHAFDKFDLTIARAFQARQIAFLKACL